jgi:hypothetical protein
MASSVEVTPAVKIEQVRRKWDHLGMSEPATRQLEVVHEGPSFRLMDYRCRLPVLAKGPEEGPSANILIMPMNGGPARESAMEGGPTPGEMYWSGDCGRRNQGPERPR